MAKSCLILPPDPRDYPTIARLANTAVTFDKNAAATLWFQFCKGFADYRGGHFAEAERWMQKVLEHKSEGSSRDVEAYMVLAMAEYRMGHIADAHSVFNEGKTYAASALREVSSGDIDSGWPDWVLARALMREAERLLEPPPKSHNTAPD